MRQRYIFYTMVSIGDILGGWYLIHATIMRLRTIVNGTYEIGTSRWNCTIKGYAVLRILSTELVSVTMLMMSVEKVYAVLFAVHYRRYSTPAARYVAAIGCFNVCLLSLAAMYLTSYFDTNTTLENNFCGIQESTVDVYALFHEFFIILCQVGSLICSAFAYWVARKVTKELITIRPILFLSFFSCIIFTSENIARCYSNSAPLNVQGFNGSLQF